MIEAGLYTLLSTAAAVTAITGQNIFPDEVPKNPTYPALEFRIITETPDPTMDTSGYQRLRFEFTCKAATPSVAAALAGALRKLLEGYNGALSDGTFLQDAQFADFRGGYDRDALVYLRTIEFFLFFNFSS
jgi:hypothetical protein